MAEVAALVKIQIPAGKATPAPPVGTALGPHGIDIKSFCDQFNDNDRTFSFITKTPPAAVLIKKAINLKSGSGRPNTEKVGKITRAQLKEIAEIKMPDINAFDIDQAINIIAGTARSMGVEVEG